MFRTRVPGAGLAAAGTAGLCALALAFAARPARAVSGHPLLQRAAETVAREWKFRPPPAGGRQFGRIAFHFGTAPPGGKQE